MKVKTKKRICGWVFGLCFLSAYGVCGSLECQTVDPVLGDVLLWSFLTLGTAAGYKGGYIWIRRGSTTKERRQDNVSL